MQKTRLFGRDMSRQSTRRRLVAAVYALLALLVLGGWRLDQLHTSGVYLYFAAYFVATFIFGGYGASGLIKPFNGNGLRVRPMPSSLVELQLRATGALDDPDANKYRNDERELQRRDRVHYQAYQGICVLLVLLWFLAHWQLHPPQFIPAGLPPILVYSLALPAVLLAITLPQAILLWTEPDLDPAGPDPQTAVRTIP